MKNNNIKILNLNQAADPNQIKIPNFDDNGRYQAVIEKNSFKNSITEEIQEYFDRVEDLGIAVTTLAGIRTIAYSYFKLNELLLVSGIFQIEYLNSS